MAASGESGSSEPEHAREIADILSMAAVRHRAVVGIVRIKPFIIKMQPLEI